MKKLFLMICAVLISGCVCCPLTGDVEIIRKATEARDPSLCDGVGSLEMQVACYGVVAVEKDDITVCDRLETAILKRPMAEGEVITGREAKELCISIVAGSKKDPSLCERIATPSIKESCLQSAKAS